MRRRSAPGRRLSPRTGTPRRTPGSPEPCLVAGPGVVCHEGGEVVAAQLAQIPSTVQRVETGFRDDPAVADVVEHRRTDQKVRIFVERSCHCLGKARYGTDMVPARAERTDERLREAERPRPRVNRHRSHTLPRRAPLSHWDLFLSHPGAVARRRGPSCRRQPQRARNWCVGAAYRTADAGGLFSGRSPARHRVRNRLGAARGFGRTARIRRPVQRGSRRRGTGCCSRCP